MQALTFQGIQQIAYESVPFPELSSPTDVIVKVELTAICGSDLHVYHGREKGLDPGTVMGHEFTGTVAEKGSGVTNFRKGDKVFSPFFTCCGACFYCNADLSCRCEKGQLFGWVESGRGLHGAQAEYVRVPLADATLTHIPENHSPEEALLLADILPTGMFAADMAEVSPGDVVAVIGCGPVGLMAIACLNELGAAKIFAVDLIAGRLTLAEKFGAAALNAQQENPLTRIREATRGRGADAVIEAVGSPSAQKLALDVIRPGGILSVPGVHNSKHFAFPPAALYNRNITYKTGRCPVKRYLAKLVPMMQSKKYELTAVVSHRLPLSEGVEGYRIFDQKLDGCIKVVLQP